MATSKKKESTKIIEWLGTGWGAFLTAITIFGTGFGVGIYVANMRSDLEGYKKDASYNQQPDFLKPGLFFGLVTGTGTWV